MLIESRKELLAYLAGFLEGEGSFGIIYDCNGTFSGRMSASQVDLRPLELLQQTFGGKLFTDKKYYVSRLSGAIISQWIITGPTMYKALLEVRPYLLVKAEQADCLLHLQESINQYKGKVGRNREFSELPREVLEHRALLYVRCKNLKHGPAATTNREGLPTTTEGCDSLDCIDGKDAEVAEMPTRLFLIGEGHEK